jgi:2-keto-4-pentenoate hydratase/2-oxohepta-3-ene-1,7-dioic acid hydratase in catechol pathway
MVTSMAAVEEGALTAPEKIICVEVNNPDRNAEYNGGQDAPPNRSLFVRFPSGFTGHTQARIRPRASHLLDYEREIVIAIGKAGRHIVEAHALDHIAALSLCNEGALRDWVRHAKIQRDARKNLDSTESSLPGDTIEVEAEAIRALRNTVTDEVT